LADYSQFGHNNLKPVLAQTSAGLFGYL